MILLSRFLVIYKICLVRDFLNNRSNNHCCVTPCLSLKDVQIAQFSNSLTQQIVLTIDNKVKQKMEEHNSSLQKQQDLYQQLCRIQNEEKRKNEQLEESNNIQIHKMQKQIEKLKEQNILQNSEIQQLKQTQTEELKKYEKERSDKYQLEQKIRVMDQQLISKNSEIQQLKQTQTEESKKYEKEKSDKYQLEQKQEDSILKQTHSLELKNQPIFYNSDIQQHLLQKDTFEFFPLQCGFSPEDFNILTDSSEIQRETIISDWLDNIKDTSKFKNFLLFFVNSMKMRALYQFKKILYHIQKYKGKGQLLNELIGNMKALFQLLYHNSNDELQYILLKVYSSSQFHQFFKIHIKTYQNRKGIYMFLMTNFINLSLSQLQTKIGKTWLINQIFYGEEKFQIEDTCKLNNSTIDIMCDAQFNGSRNFSVADVHGQIPVDILIKILPLFRMWIIQLDSVKELNETYLRLNQINRILIKQNHKICVIIRNHKEIDEKQYKEFQVQFESDGIMIHKIIDLNHPELNRSLIQNELNHAQAFIFKEIYNGKKIPDFINDQEYVNVLKNFDTNQQVIFQFIKDRATLKDFEQELNRLIQKPLGFYHLEAFPIRSIEYQIKVLKEKQNDNIQKDIKNQILSICKIFCLLDVFVITKYF